MTAEMLSKKDLRLRFWFAIASLVFGTLIMAIKFYAHAITGSQGIYSDALESIVNVVTAALALFVVRYASQPVDTDHPYGRGKVEYFSSAFEGGLIFLAAIFIVAEAIQALIKGHTLSNLDKGFLYSVLAAVMNLALGLGLLWVSKASNSVALRASGLHILSDVWTTVGVIVGLLLVRLTGIAQIDIWAAIGVGLYLAWTGFGLLREAIGGLIDSEDLVSLGELAQVFEESVVPGIIQIHHTKIIRSGWFHHIDAHVVMPEFWSIERAHEVLNNFEKSVITAYRYSGEMNFHLDPCRRRYCNVCDLADCSIRQAEFNKRMPVELEHLRSKTEPNV